MRRLPQIRMHPGRRGRSFGTQQFDRIIDALEFFNPQSLALLAESVADTGVPDGAIPWYNPGPSPIDKGFLYGLDAPTNAFVRADGITASVIQPLFVAATAIPPNTTGWAWIIGPAEVAPDGGAFPLNAAVWLSATAGFEGTITTTRPVGQTQFMMGWVMNTTPTADSLLRVFLLPQPKRT